MKKDKTTTWILIILALIAAWFFMQTPKLNAVANASQKVNTPIGSILAGLTGLFTGGGASIANKFKGLFGSNSDNGWINLPAIDSATKNDPGLNPPDIGINILD